METRTDSNTPRLLTYLPSIFQAQAAREGDPVNAILTIFEEMIGSIEDKIEKTSMEFDPDTARSKPDKNADFLSWLASWVDLTVDGEWEGQKKDAILRKKRHFIKKAAELYRYRGTAVGLKYMLGAFYDVDVEIREWTWPTSMQIGVNSTIGVHTTIMEQLDLSRCFVLVVHLDQTQRAKLAAFVDLCPTSLVGHGNISVMTPLLKRQQTGQEQFIRRLEKIRNLIDREKPAHTHCYIVIDEPAPERSPVRKKVKAMTINVHSTIGSCAIA